MMQQTVLFRVDTGPDVGLGHIQRCVSLAVALVERGATCSFLTSDPAALFMLADFDLEAETMAGVPAGSASDAQETMEVARRNGCGAVVVDSYRVNEEYLAQLVDSGLFVVAIDDLAKYPFPCQMVINSSIAATGLSYRSVTGNTVFFLGSDYALVRPEFWALPARTLRARVERVLVTLGGGDIHGLMPTLVQVLDHLPGEFELDIVIGPFFHNRPQIEEAARVARHRIALVDVPEKMYALMLQADLAISAGGQTLYELAATGTPTVAFEITDNQTSNIAGFVAAGAVRSIGRAGDQGLVARLSSVVELLMNSADERAQMAETGQRLVDAQGPRRIADRWTAGHGTLRQTSAAGTLSRKWKKHLR